MPVDTFNQERSKLYGKMFESMIIPEPFQAIVMALAKRAMQHKDSYMKVQEAINIPWYLVAAIHYRESNFNFTTHLHNGNSLTRRTVDAPAGRPVKGNPPFTWYESAIDALLYDNMENIDAFTIGEQLVKLEQYNGTGYIKYHKMYSPYLWSYTQFYDTGKYASDGHFDANLRDKQSGVAPLIAAIVGIDW